MRKGKYLTNEVQASEKVYQDFHLEVTNPGGHSSLPVKDNAIYHLAGGLARLAAFDFPVQLNEVTRALLRAIGGGRRTIRRWRPTCAPSRGRRPIAAAAARLSASLPYYNSLMRTTCVATRLQGGHANNALPQMATRERELPHPAGRVAGVGQGQARRSARRSEDHGDVRRRSAIRASRRRSALT